MEAMNMRRSLGERERGNDVIILKLQKIKNQVIKRLLTTWKNIVIYIVIHYREDLIFLINK